MAEEKQKSENITDSKQDAQGNNIQEADEIDTSVEKKPPSATDFLSMHAAHSTGESYTPSDEELKQRNKRSLAIAGGIVAFMLLVFMITVLRIGGAAG
ncbi:MAG: hypothetical protein MRY72_07050 [Aquisalinus sp.]|nr:hypothetical protein [Aquisalinus sp.]